MYCRDSDNDVECAKVPRALMLCLLRYLGIIGACVPETQGITLLLGGGLYLNLSR
jgi:hypothetical protein